MPDPASAVQAGDGEATGRMSRPSGRRRWVVCALLFLAITINYIDRQIIGVLKPVLSDHFGWSEIDYGNIVFWFQAAYAVGLLTVGRLLDAVGTRIGLAVSVAVWSVAAMAHGAAGAVSQFAMARFALGLGEAGGYPAAIKAVSEWFPKRERALAAGILNAGANLGAVATPILAPLIVLAFGWRAAFVVTGTLGLIWLLVWWMTYRRPADDPRLEVAERAWIESDPIDPPGRTSWRELIRRRHAWAFILAKFLTDPVWWLFLFWLPDFFAKTYGLNLLTFGPALVVVYLLADAGSIGGGWMSSRLIERGWSVDRARKGTLLVCALCVMPLSLAIFAENLFAAVAVIGLAAAAHQGWSANLFTLVSDVFPRRDVATVVGMGGFAGAVGGMFIAKLAGWTLETTGSYVPLLLMASVAYLVGLGVIQLLAPERAAMRVG